MDKNKKKIEEEFYKNEGIVIYVKGNPMLMIHPDNLENNTKALNNGDLKIDWELLLSRANGTEEHDENWWNKEITEYAKSILKTKSDK